MGALTIKSENSIRFVFKSICLTCGQYTMTNYSYPIAPSTVWYCSEIRRGLRLLLRLCLVIIKVYRTYMLFAIMLHLLKTNCHFCSAFIAQCVTAAPSARRLPYMNWRCSAACRLFGVPPSFFFFFFFIINYCYYKGDKPIVPKISGKKKVGRGR